MQTLPIADKANICILTQLRSTNNSIHRKTTKAWLLRTMLILLPVNSTRTANIELSFSFERFVLCLRLNSSPALDQVRRVFKPLRRFCELFSIENLPTSERPDKCYVEVLEIATCWLRTRISREN